LVTPIDLAWLAKLDGEHLGLAAELEFCAVRAQFSGLQISFENPKPDNLEADNQLLPRCGPQWPTV
jgi:hypothetical protein